MENKGHPKFSRSLLSFFNDYFGDLVVAELKKIQDNFEITWGESKRTGASTVAYISNTHAAEDDLGCCVRLELLDPDVVMVGYRIRTGNIFSWALFSYFIDINEHTKQTVKNLTNNHYHIFPMEVLADQVNLLIGTVNAHACYELLESSRRKIHTVH